MTEWSKTFIDWTEDNTAYLSVVFTWDLPKAYQRAIWWREQGYMVRVGGPACLLMPDYLAEVAEVNGAGVDALPRHNPNATFTSRGCIRKCAFCAVPKIEGDLVELDEWEAKPIVCDNNLLACSQKHFNRVIDSLKGVEGVDFNQGLDARLLKQYHADRLAELNLACVRLAWDSAKYEEQFWRAEGLLSNVGIPKSKLRTYMLIGFDDDPDDALYRLQSLKDAGYLSSPMRYQPLDALKRDTYVAPNWTNRELRRFMHYWFRQAWLGHISFEEFKDGGVKQQVKVKGQIEMGLLTKGEEQ